MRGKIRDMRIESSSRGVMPSPGSVILTVLASLLAPSGHSILFLPAGALASD
jgi:hypothetical protein